MGLTGQRVFLTGLGLGPAIAVIVLPASALALPVSLALAGAASVYAILSSLRAHAGESGFARSGTPLLRASVLRDPALDLPDLATMRGHIAATLAMHTPRDGKPPLRTQSVAIALRRIMRAWACPEPDALNLEEVTELFLLDRLLHAPVEDAVELAEQFRRPDLVLAMRDEVDSQAARRAELDRQAALFRATAALWQGGSSGEPEDLLAALRALPFADIDLWHHLVTSHDPQDPAQRSAALWCLGQPECDQATVAAYLSHVAADGQLQAAARRGDQAFLDAVLGLIEAWNRGAYGTRELALDPADTVATDAPRLAAELDALADITGSARWPEPRGLFAEYTGRPPRCRAFWCLRTGRVQTRPEPVHFLPPEALPHAA